MQQYFFHVRDHCGEAADDEGMELPDLAAAHNVALQGARSLICADVMKGKLDLAGRITVANATGAPLMVLSFAEAVDLVHTLPESELDR